VVSELREEIVTGRLAPGAALRQEEIAERYGVSHIPVREAFRLLESEGLVELRPRRGAFVAQLSADEYEEICDMRVALETCALRLAIPRLAKRDLAAAEAILDRIDREPGHWGALNTEFHCALYAAAGRPRMLATIRALNRNAERYLHAEAEVVGNLARSQREHRKLLALAKQGKADEASLLVTDHIRTDARKLLRRLVQPGTISEGHG
jgi:DNA-binding GntR family transcriptional regulator